MKAFPVMVGVGGFLAAILASVLLSDDEDTWPSQGLDDYAPHEPTPAGACSPTAKPGVLMFRQWALGRWPERPGSPQNILRDCSIGASTEHWEGRAWDWMIGSAESAEAFLKTLLAPSPRGEPDELARRAGIMYMIYNRRMWRAYPLGNQPRGWAPYTGPNPHTDHIHFSFSRAGAAGETSLYRAAPKAIA